MTSGDIAPARLLIVDDEVAQMTALCNTLQDEGYVTRGFTSGRSALAELREHSFDVLLTDLMMPGMDGIALLTAAQDIDRRLVCIVMTGHGAVDTAVKAMQSGALDYIQKPFKLRQILPVLARALTVRRLRVANAQLEHSVQERNAELEAAYRDLESFSYSVSHDLRAPLRIISGYADFLSEESRDSLNDEGRHAVDTIRATARRMANLIGDLLEFARFSRQQPTLARVRTHDLVRQVVEDLNRAHADRSINVTMAELPDCFGDESLVRQVFFNLLSNAYKFTSRCERASIEVDGRRREGEVAFCIRDNGAGFDMAQADKLFGVFQRLHRDDEFEGTGIGLSIVERIVRRHGGRVSAESAPGKGAAFHFTLPAAD
jgi:signal transduction histidine kinase